MDNVALEKIYREIMMGGFVGHILPGVSLYLISLWWTINVIRHYISALAFDGTPYRAHFYYASSLVRLFPLESVFKLLLGVILVVLQLRDAYHDGKIIYMESVLHLTSYAATSINGLLEMIHYNSLTRNSDRTNRMLEPIGLLLNMFAAAFLAHSHVHLNTWLGQLVHTLLVFTATIVIVSILIEIWHREWVICSMVRVIAVQTFGTWLTHIGFILFPTAVGLDHWNHYNPVEFQLALILYFFHWMLSLCMTFLLTAVIQKLSVQPASKVPNPV